MKITIKIRAQSEAEPIIMLSRNCGKGQYVVLLEQSQGNQQTPMRTSPVEICRAVQMIGLDDATERKCRHKKFEIQLRDRDPGVARALASSASLLFGHSIHPACGGNGYFHRGMPSTRRGEKASVHRGCFRLLDGAMSKFLLVHFVHNQRDQ